MMGVVDVVSTSRHDVMMVIISSNRPGDDDGGRWRVRAHWLHVVVLVVVIQSWPGGSIDLAIEVC